MEEFNNDDILILLKKALAINATSTKNKAAQEESTKSTEEQNENQTKLPNIQCSDILLSLEKMDENFHKYAFVKKLQERVSSVVLPILESQPKINDNDPES